MSAPCETVLERIPLYLEDALTAEDRREFRDHLASCPACRDRVAGVEPSLLFARVGPEEVSAEDVAQVLAGVRAGIALARSQRRVGASRGSRRRMAAMASAAALAAMTFVLPGSARRPADTLVMPLGVSVSATGAGVTQPTGFSPASGEAPSATFPADATIYDWNPGAASQEPRVIWIVDRSLDI